MSDQSTPAAPAAPVTPAVVPAAPMSQEQAVARIDANRKDPGFRERFAKGDAAARLEMDHLHKQAYPGESTLYNNGETRPAPSAAEIDTAFPPAKPNEYTAPAVFAPGDPQAKEFAQLDGRIRGTLADGGFTKEIGNYVYSEVFKTFASTRRMNDAQFMQYESAERQRLEQLWGADTEKKIKQAKQLVRELEQKRPGIAALLYRTGAGSSAAVVAQFAAQAERLAVRSGA